MPKLLFTPNGKLSQTLSQYLMVPGQRRSHGAAAVGAASMEVFEQEDVPEARPTHPLDARFPRRPKIWAEAVKTTLCWFLFLAYLCPQLPLHCPKAVLLPLKSLYVLHRKEALSSLQIMEQADIRAGSDSFGESVDEYRRFFLHTAPFAITDAELKLEHVRA